MRSLLKVVIGWSVGIAGTSPAWAQAVFTYQGQLRDDGAPANGPYDMAFRLYDVASGGSPIGIAVYVDDWPVINGLFSVELDFGSSPFEGGPRWLQVEVRPGISTSAYTILMPRQPLTAVPYAMYAYSGPASDGPWNSVGNDIHNANSGNVGIGTGAPTSKLQVAGEVRARGELGLTVENPNNAEAIAALGWLNNVARLRIGGGGDGATNGLDIQRTGDRSLMRLDGNGDVTFAGVIDLDLGLVQETGQTAETVARCPDGKNAVSGGCWCNCPSSDGVGASRAVLRTQPLIGLTGWVCTCESAALDAIAFAVCARVR